MCQVFKPISISLSPNTEKDDIRLALKLIFQPWRWKKGLMNQALEIEFKNYFGTKYAFGFNSGRSGFMAILSSLGLNRGDSAFAKASADKEVLLQAFTCNAAVNPILWSDLKPIFVDCNEQDFNIDIDDLKRKITSQSRAIVVQHTFGLLANMDEIVKICEKNNLILIEDCAHSLGARYQSNQPEKADKNGICKKSSPLSQTQEVGLPAEAQRSRAKAGTFGKAAFFSFSRDKVVSSVYGGMVITNDDELAEKIKEFQKEKGYPYCCWILQQLLHPVLINYIILPTYNFFKLGKILLILSQIFRILSKAVHFKEKKAQKPEYFPKRMPNALAVLALHQFQKLERFNEHRKKIAEFYYQELKNSNFELPQIPKGSLWNSKGCLWEGGHIFLRFSVKHPKAHQIIRKAWQKNLLIGDWYTSPIAPDDTQLEKVGYKLGTCPKAEKLAKITLNLPTHINIDEKEAERIVNFLKKWK